MTGTSINISRENIAQAVENVTKLSREEIQKWRDFVNEELKKTDLDEKTKEKYQKYKAIFEKTSAQINSLQGEMPLQPIDKNTGTAPVSPAKSTESQSVSVSPEQQKKQKEEIEEYGQDVAVKLAEILVKDGEINQQGIKNAMELVNDLSQLKYKDNPDLNLKLEASELDVLKKVPHAVKGVVGSVFLSSLYANGYTVRFIGNEQVSLHKHKDAPVVRLGEGTDLTHSINNFIKGNPGFLEVLKAGLLFHSGDLAKYVDTNSSYGKLNAWTHNYRSFSQYLNKRTEETLPGASMKESQDNLFNDEEFKNYLGVASVMPEDIVSVTKKLSENEKVKQLFKEWIATAGLAQTVPQAVRQTHTPEERAQIMSMYDNERPGEYQKRLKDNPGGTLLETFLVDGFIQGTQRTFGWLSDRPLKESIPAYFLLTVALGAMLLSKNRWKWLGGVATLLTANGLWNKYNKLEDARDLYNETGIDQNTIKAAADDMKQYVTEEEKQKNTSKIHQTELAKVDPELAKDPKKLAEATQESMKFSDYFKNEKVSAIKNYIDNKTGTFENAENKTRMDDEKNKTNTMVLRAEIATMDSQFEGFLSQLTLRDNENPEKILKLTSDQEATLRNRIRIAFNDMTLDQRRNFFAMTPDERDKWMNSKKGELDESANLIGGTAMWWGIGLVWGGLLILGLKVLWVRGVWAILKWPFSAKAKTELKNIWEARKNNKGTNVSSPNAATNTTKPQKFDPNNPPKQLAGQSDADFKQATEEWTRKMEAHAQKTQNSRLRTWVTPQSTINKQNQAYQDALQTLDDLNFNEKFDTDYKKAKKLDKLTLQQRDITRNIGQKTIDLAAETDPNKQIVLRDELKILNDQLKDVNERIAKQGVVPTLLTRKIGGYELTLSLQDFKDLKSSIKTIKDLETKQLMRKTNLYGVYDDLTAEWKAYRAEYEKISHLIDKWFSGDPTKFDSVMTPYNSKTFIDDIFDASTGKPKGLLKAIF